MNIKKAIAYVYPNAVEGVDYTLRRVGNEYVVATWSLPNRPFTRNEIIAHAAAYDASMAGQDDTRIRNSIVSVASGTEGKVLTALTAQEVRALLAVLLYKSGALNPDATVKPLAQWALL